MSTNPKPSICRRDRRRGAITLEAAMIFPVLLMIFFGSIEFAWMFYVRHGLSNAAREGARVAIVETSNVSNVTNAIKTAIDNGGLKGMNYSVSFARNGSAVTTSAQVAAIAPGDALTVTLTAPWSQFSVLNTPIASFWTKDIKASATMRREG